MQGIYEAAELYHYAFGFRDTARDAGVLMAASDRFGNGGRRFLEIACGDCPYVLELMQAGVDYHGLDLSSSMVAFSAERARAAGYSVDDRLHLADMRDFLLPKTFDLAFVLMGSLHFLANNEFLQHLDRVHAHLAPGGIYVLEWCIEYSPTVEKHSTWTEESPLGEIHIDYHLRQQSALGQQFEERINFIVNGALAASSIDTVYMRYPNEFALLLQSHAPLWEIVGHFNHWDLDDPLVDSSEVNRPLCILRKLAGENN
ncbi:MAG: class I SAM-dependent methyltransferase [Caldilineaceae bacterium]